MKAKRYALGVGFGAVIAMGAFGLAHQNTAPTATLAGSGDAPTGTVYVQPTAKGMVLGVTSVVETVSTTSTKPGSP